MSEVRVLMPGPSLAASPRPAARIGLKFPGVKEGYRVKMAPRPHNDSSLLSIFESGPGGNSYYFLQLFISRRQEDGENQILLFLQGTRLV